MMDKKPCVRCLLAEMEGVESLKAAVRKAIADIPENERAAPETAACRLKVCRECAYLDRATCMQCGCFVELRSAMARARCPMKAWPET